MTLYNLKSADGEWRITKFDDDLNVESSYLVSEKECECPAGSRDTCRHRQMLPIMLEAEAQDSALFYDFENKEFYEMAETEQEVQEIAEGIEVMTLDNIGKVHNTIAEALGEPTLKEEVARLSAEQAKDFDEPHPLVNSGKINRRI